MNKSFEILLPLPELSVVITIIIFNCKDPNNPLFEKSERELGSIIDRNDEKFQINSF